jgi:hypothetical protein
MSVQCVFVVTCLLAAHLAASAATLDVYGELIGKTILALGPAIIVRLNRL